MTLEELEDLLQSIKNRCRIAMILLRLDPQLRAEELLPTVLEDMYEDCQNIVLNYCVKGDK